MGVLKRKKGVMLSNLTAARSMCVVVCIFGMVALICAFGCEKKVGVRPSAGGPGTAVAAESGQPETLVLTNAQCVLCHPQQPETIATKGGLHKTEVGCLDCHVEHPPEGAGAIPDCSMCHSGEPHYELKNCGSCHSDTHAPLELKLQGEISEPCLTCHQQQGDEVKKYKSAHTDVACNECHTVHRQIPDCMECHEKHTPDMEFEACISCHPVHMPTQVAYAQDVSSGYCGGCHEQAYHELEKNTTKHHDLACAYCHRDKHKVVPPCYACHGSPHPKAILDKYPNCGQCHGIAHDLKG